MCLETNCCPVPAIFRDAIGFWPMWGAQKGVGAFNMARKPASDFGWDWGPAYTPSGIHGAVDLVGYDHAVIQGGGTVCCVCSSTPLSLE